MYASLLKSCSRSRGLFLWKRVHARLARHGLDTVSPDGNYVVSLLVKRGGLEDALEVLESLQHRTATSWSAVISGYTNIGQGLKALSLYRNMLEEGLHPDKYTFCSLLKACSSLGDLEEGKRMHTQAVNSRYATDLVVGTCVVDMYAKCGSISDAQHVFNTLVQRDVVSWNVMLAAYCQQGQGEHALQLYYEMLLEGFLPDDRTFVRALQACGSLAENERCVHVDGQSLRVESLQKGQALHAEAWRMGFASDVFVGSTLVSMYGKCGSTKDAEKVFNELPHRNVVSWAAVLSACAQQNQAEKACQIYDQMLDAGVSPNDRSLVSVLQALGSLAERDLVQVAAKLEALQKGKAVHVESIRRGLAKDVFVCNALLGMYAKCGSVLDAQLLFDGLWHQDVVSWNALLAGYAQQGQGQMTMKLYQEMKERGAVSPDAPTFVILLRACNLTEEETTDLVDEQSIRVSSLQKCKAIHADALRRGLQQDVFFSSTLISLYTKCGSLLDAQNFFDELVQPDVVSWNAILAGYSQRGNGEAVLKLYGEMYESGVSPDAWTFVSALQACGMVVSVTGSTALTDEKLFHMRWLQQGRELHAVCQRLGHSLHGFVGNALVSMYGRCQSISDAQYVFASISQQDIVSWNALLAAYVQQNQGEKALQFFHQMQEDMVTPDSRTFVSLLQACSCLAEEEVVVFLDGQSVRAQSLQKGKVIHTEAQRKCCELDDFVVNSLVTMYAKCGSTRDAHLVFDSLSQRNVVSWNAIIAAYSQQGQGDKSLALYEEMLMEDVKPDDSTFVCVLQACASIGALHICQRVHENLVSDGRKLSPFLAGTLVHSYGKLARMEAARDVFDVLRDSNVVTWTALIAGYARQGDYDKSLQCYEEMQLAGVKPNSVTFCSLLAACSHAGMVDKGLEYFISMTTDYGVIPETEHYVNMMDLLGRAGFFSLIEDLLSSMSVKADASLWLCILNSCRKHGNVALGKRAFDSIVSSQPQLSSPYLLMANIYSQAGMWDCARKVHELREEVGAFKKPAQTWVELRQDVRTFSVGDREHPQDEYIYDLVEMLSKELEQVQALQNEEEYGRVGRHFPKLLVDRELSL